MLWVSHMIPTVYINNIFHTKQTPTLVTKCTNKNIEISSENVDLQYIMGENATPSRRRLGRLVVLQPQNGSAR